MFIEQEESIKTIRHDGFIIYKNKEGLYHRLDGPSCISLDGSKFWYKKGQLHRIDGPAVEHSTGYKEYHIEGIFYGEKHFLKIVNGV